MIPFGLSSLMTVSLPMARRATKCVPVDEPIPGFSAFFLFDEGSGTTVLDHSGNEYHGAISGTPVWGATGLTFAAGGYADCGTGAGLNLTNQDHTLIYVCTPASTSLEAIFGKVTFNPNECGLAQNGGKFTYYYRSALAPDAIAANAAYTAGTPYMVTCRRAGTTRTIHIGTTKQTATGTTDIAPDTSAMSFYIGRRTSGGSTFTGVNHAGLVYPVALTDAQLYHNYVYLKDLLAARGVTLA